MYCVLCIMCRSMYAEWVCNLSLRYGFQSPQKTKSSTYFGFRHYTEILSTGHLNLLTTFSTYPLPGHLPIVRFKKQTKNQIVYSIF